MERHRVLGRPRPTFRPVRPRRGPAPGTYRVVVNAWALIPAVVVLVPPGPVRRPVAVPDVSHSPADLGPCVPFPARPGSGHLAAGDRLRDAVGARERVGRIAVPPAFGGP